MERTVIGSGEYGYVAGFNGREIEVWAPSLWKAKQEALHFFKPSKRRQIEVWVVLAETPSGQVVHVADF